MSPGDKHFSLTAIDFISEDMHGNQRWQFRCDCGAVREARASDVRRGNTKSCGCQRVIGRKHEARRAAKESRCDSLLRSFSDA